MILLSNLLKVLITTGTLQILDAKGKRHSFIGQNPGREVTIRFNDTGVPWAIARNPALAMGEVYMEGRVDVIDGDIRDFLDLIMLNLGWERTNILSGPIKNLLGRILGMVLTLNPAARSKKNVAHHYDLSGALYDLFLDHDRQYSCAYFADDTVSLDDAQTAKKAHIAAKLLLKPGQRILDIGCGWGGLGLSLNKLTGAHVTGVTLSEEQLAIAQQRARDNGVADLVDFRLQDYRAISEQFDRIVSVGMFEHVGALQYPTFFRKVNQVLKDDGVVLLHTIGRADGPGRTNPWIQKYIFPGGYSPALSEIVPLIEDAGFYITDIEILRLHYAKTLDHWYNRTKANRDKVVALYSEGFARMWEFYLAASQKTFEYSGHVVFQIQMAKKQNAVPLTRDYMAAAEQQYLKELESGQSPVLSIA